MSSAGANMAMTGIFLLLQLILAILLYIFCSLYWMKRKIINLDKALIGVVYVALATAVYPTLITFSHENALSHIHINESILSREECHNIINNANVEAELRHGWTTRRHKSYPTTDLSVYDMDKSLNSFVSWLNNTIESRVFPQLTLNFDVPSSSFVMRDLFIVKYDEHGQRSLPEHRDNSKISFNIALSSRGLDFQGGGTTFTILNHTINIGEGSLLSHDSGVYHSGSNVLTGTRYILVGFVQIKEAYWWRTFGTYASCISYPSESQSAEQVTNEGLKDSDSENRETICRSRFWTAKHQLLRTLEEMMLLINGTDGSTINIDFNFKIVTYILFILGFLLLVLFSLLVYSCVLGGGLSRISSLDITLMKWLSLLSDEELAFLAQEEQEEKERRMIGAFDDLEGNHVQTVSAGIRKQYTGRYDRSLLFSCVPQNDNSSCKKD